MLEAAVLGMVRLHDAVNVSSADGAAVEAVAAAKASYHMTAANENRVDGIGVTDLERREKEGEEREKESVNGESVSIKNKNKKRKRNQQVTNQQ